MRVVGTAVIAKAHLLKINFSIDLSNCYNLAFKLVFDTERP